MSKRKTVQFLGLLGKDENKIIKVRLSGLLFCLNPISFYPLNVRLLKNDFFV